MTQARLSSSNDDAARTLDVAPSVPSRAGRQLPRKDYAQMHSGGPAPAASQKRPCGRSASPTNRRAPTRQRSPLPPSSQDAIESPDSISQTSQRVPGIMKKTWKKKPRTGVRSAFRSKYLGRVGCSISDI